MKFDYQYAGVAEKDIEHHADTLEAYQRYLLRVAEEGGYTKKEGSINLPFDKSVLGAARELSEKKKSEELSYIVVVGIGGSNLGAKAVYDALYGSFDVFDSNRHPKIIFLDTTSTSLLTRFTDFLNVNVKDPEEVVVNVISKSGETTETIANIEYVFALLKEKFGEEEAKSRTVVTTDVYSKLWTIAEEEGIAHLGIPERVGGRFSVFSAVGLFPLLLSGVDTEKLLEGARSMCETCLTEEKENPAALSASVLFHQARNGRRINDNFIFHPELESLGKWYRQLVGESIGKEKDREGNVVHAGITPTVSIGSTDLHSMGQLYLGGPRDKMTTFLYSSQRDGGVKMPEERLFPELVSMIEKKSSHDIIEAIYEGTKRAYITQELPFMEVTLGSIAEEELGAYLQFKMMEIMYLGELLHIDAFDQPQVELYKEETRKLLGQ